MNHASISHAISGLAGASLVVLLGLARAPQTPPVTTTSAASPDEVVLLLRSIDQKLDSRLVATPATIGQAVHRVGFIAESLDKDMKQLLTDTRKLVSDVGSIQSRSRNWRP